MSESEAQGLVPLHVEQAIDEAPEELRRLILFQACDEWFGLPIELVREIHPLDRLTRVPNAPAAILGILNLRGRVLTLLDLSGCLGIPPGTRPNSHAVVLEVPDPELCIGLAAQQIAPVRPIPASTVEPPPREGGVAGLEGVFPLEGRVAGLLDLGRLLARALPDSGVTGEGRGPR